jgi:hypothetical protein
MFDPVLKILTGQLLALRLKLEKARLGGGWCRQPTHRQDQHKTQSQKDGATTSGHRKF